MPEQEEHRAEEFQQSEAERPMNAAAGTAQQRMDKLTTFTGVVAAFTAVLALLAAFQVWAFMKSEAAFLVVENANFRGGEPSADPGGLDVGIVVKNVGKHTATILGGRLVSNPRVENTPLPDQPDYYPALRADDVINRLVAPGTFVSIITDERQGGGVEVKPPGMPTVSEFIERLRAGQGAVYVYGFLRYKTGFSLFGPSTIGFCFRYLRAAERVSDRRFEQCRNPNYTYAD